MEVCIDAILSDLFINKTENITETYFYTFKNGKKGLNLTIILYVNIVRKTCLR